MGLGGTRRHRRERHCDYRGRGPLVLLKVSFKPIATSTTNVHLLKLVTGVEISTRAVNKSGRPGKPVKRRRRTAAAAPNRAAFLLSMLIVLICQS